MAKEVEFSAYEIERRFLEFLSREGVFFVSGTQLKLDGKKHRVGLEGHKNGNKDGEYKIFADNYPQGWLHDWRSGEYYFWKLYDQDSSYKNMTPEEKQALAEQWEKEREIKKQEEASVRAHASRIAMMKWEAATSKGAISHPYAVRKGLTDVFCAKVLGSDLIIPLYDTSGAVVNIQTINTKGQKYFPANAPKAGNFSILHNSLAISQSPCSRAECSDEKSNIIELPLSSRTWITEGYATGSTVASATGESVIVAIDAGNLLPVVKNIRRLWPETEFVIAADNDHKTSGNPGLSAALKVFEETGIPFVFPYFEKDDEGTDWNDYAASFGIKKCRAHILHSLNSFKKKGLYVLKHREPLFVDTTDSGRPLGTVENLRALLNFAGMSVSYDEIKKEEVFSLPGRSYCGDNAKNAAIGEILSLCSRWRMPKSDIEPLISNIGSQNIINPVKDWILSEPWDGINRIQNIYDSVVEESSFPRAFKETLIRRWLISGVAAAFMKRGFHCRGVLTFIGGQGIGKTTWFRTIAGKDEFFSEGLGLNLKDKDSIKSAISSWCVEFGELEATFNRSELPILKSFLTRSSDKIRMPWSRKESDFQRRTFYGATVNQRQILLDDTGNGRWWCIPLERIDMIQKNEMQQMWRQVYECYYLKYTEDKHNKDCQWWLSKEEDAMLEEQNKEFEVPSGVEEMIVSGLEWESSRSFWSFRTTTQILHECGYPPALPKPGELIKASKVLHKLTGEKSKPMGHSNARMWFVPPKKTIY